MNCHAMRCTADEVRAILARTKTRISRPMKTQPPNRATEVYVEAVYGEWVATYRAFPDGGSARWGICASPFGGPGDRLWVQECWGITAAENRGQFEIYDVLRGEYELLRRDVALAYHYRASDAYPGMCWRPSSHMPRCASRITLEVKRTWVERVQDISEEDVQAEGCTGSPLGPTGDAMLFPTYWNSLYAAKGFGWDGNPWVFGAEFSLIENAKASES